MLFIWLNFLLASAIKYFPACFYNFINVFRHRDYYLQTVYKLGAELQLKYIINFQFIAKTSIITLEVISNFYPKKAYTMLYQNCLNILVSALLLLLFLNNQAFAQSERMLTEPKRVLTSQKNRTGFYLTGKIGPNMLLDSDQEGTNVRLESDYDASVQINAGIGYRISDHYRVELEGIFKNNDIEQVTIRRSGPFALPNRTTQAADGYLDTYSALFNMYWDFDEISASPTRSSIFFTPYVMIGGGFGKVDAKVSTLGTNIIQDDDFVYAYQAGLGVNIFTTHRTTIDLGYRYFATEEPKLTDRLGGKLNAKYFSHSALMGFNYTF